MTNYVNEDKFFQWYSETTGSPIGNKTKLLNEVFQQYMKTRKQEYILSAQQTKSGSEETFPFRFENIGCCGASTYYIYF
ncbi:MAG: hypothetical protein IKZ30_05205 [Oscillospiraceae bacterium]|nr:hypothetical protein [Oscillospiraceae bacterium]